MTGMLARHVIVGATSTAVGTYCYSKPIQALLDIPHISRSIPAMSNEACTLVRRDEICG